MSKFSWRSINNALSVLVIVICAYTLILPFLPAIQYRANALTHQWTNDPNQLFSNAHDYNEIIVHKLFVTARINEGDTLTALEHGVWHRPHTGNPINGGNMVIAGHRFIYGANSAFYNLDKLRKDDLIGIVWNKKKYIYQVTETKVVTPNEVAIESPTKNNQLTLYTCTPLWTSKERQVVIAKFVKEQS